MADAPTFTIKQYLDLLGQKIQEAVDRVDKREVRRLLLLLRDEADHQLDKLRDVDG